MGHEIIMAFAVETAKRVYKAKDPTRMAVVYNTAANYCVIAAHVKEGTEQSLRRAKTYLDALDPTERIELVEYLKLASGQAGLNVYDALYPLRLPNGA